MERRRVTFEGRVQGVGFRATARYVARSHAVTGWVRNEPDGSVVLEVQGEREEVENYLAHLRSDMAGFIRSERGVAASALPGESGFEVRR